jgi:hypothetical protein
MNSKRLLIDLPKIDSYYENFLKTALNIQPKLIITGTLGLKLCGLFKEREVGDLDFNLTESLTEDEVLIFKDFFGLTPFLGKHEYNLEEIEEKIKETWSAKQALENPLLIQFKKYPKVKEDTDSQKNLNEKVYKIDIFTKCGLSKKEILLLDVKFSDGTVIPCKVTYPPTILSHKARIAFDPQMREYKKHYYDIIKNVIGDENYLLKVNDITQFSLYNYEMRQEQDQLLPF